MVAYEVLKRIVESGGNPYDPNDIMRAYYSIRDFSTGGLTPPITVTPDDRAGTHIIWIWQIIPDHKPIPYVNITAVDMTPYQPLIQQSIREVTGS
jgi:hypothetical protein